MRVQVSIPILVQKVRHPDEAPFYRVRPVFFEGGERTDPREDRALRYLKEDIQKTLVENAMNMRHDVITTWSFCPAMEHRRLKLVLNLRKHTLRPSLFLILFEGLNRTLAMSLEVKEVCFEIVEGQNVLQRATDVYTEHFRYLEKSGADLGDYFQEEISYSHLDFLDIGANVTQKVTQESEGPGFAMLGEQQEVSGSFELERTGRCLNRLYPNDLERARSREEEVRTIRQWMGDQVKGGAAPPLLIVGAHQVGKTALIHEWVHRFHQDRGEDNVPQIWLLSPQRLISGMSFVGQWEQRVLAIFEEARKEGHVLYFDDVIGLFSAGKTRDSNLTVGDVLKLQLEEGNLRILAEATSEAWRKLREVDRSFADLFTVIHLREPAEMETLKILIRTMQDLELLYRCEFSPEVLPLVMELSRRFVRTRSFPGKGAEMLRQLATTAPEERIGRQDVYRFFQNKTGVRQQFMDRRVSLETDQVRDFFRKRIVGQERAVSAMVDSIVLSKAQLNDPSRPICSFLFLGPTGVGKTECAKALAEYYFGSRERLLRFDMNEFNGWDAVSRLIGVFGGRQGVLTGAVRRKPHSVILLDEIEKANVDVFDLLLQVLDDGRLTDASGVTTDFCNAVIILTSNLGSQETKNRMGFGSAVDEASGVYIDAARKFFRPEFFNRLDRVVAFHELGREHISGIVHALVNQVLERQGLHRRQMSLSLDPSVYELLSHVGFEREYGARALRRAVENHLVEPLALELSQVTGKNPTFLSVSAEEGRRVTLSSRVLSAAIQADMSPVPLLPGEADSWVSQTNLYLQRLDEEMEDWEADAMEEDEEPDEHEAAVHRQLHHHYYLIREELMELRWYRDHFQALGEGRRVAEGEERAWTRDREEAALGTMGPSRQSRPLYLPLSDQDRLVDLFQAADAGRWFDGLMEEAEALDDLSQAGFELLWQASRVDFLCDPELAEADRVILRFRRSGSDVQNGDLEDRYPIYQAWMESYVQFFQQSPGLSQRILKLDLPRRKWDRQLDLGLLDLFGCDHCFLYGEGPGFADLLERVTGLELFCFPGSFEYGQVDCFPLRTGETPLRACLRVVEHSPEGLTAANEVQRIRHEKGVLDLKTGILAPPTRAPLWNFLAPLLDKPEEFRYLLRKDDGK